jgi:predicted ATPase
VLTDDQIAILKTIYSENVSIAPPQRPSADAFKAVGGKQTDVARGLYLSGFIGIDKNGKLALTDDGFELLRSLQ